MNKNLVACAAVAALGAFGSPALAGEGETHRGHGAHVHGLGKLDLAQEGPELHLRLESPAANLVGFEHAPRDAAERATLEQAVAALKDGAALFAPTPAARCTLAEVSVVSGLLVSEGGAEPEEAGHDHEPGHEPIHEPIQEQEHEKGHEKGHEHEHADESQAHADIAAEYRFLCEHPEELKEIRVMVFERFPATERLDVQMVTERGQAGATLTGANPMLRL